MSVFEVLNAVNVNDHAEKKNGLTYLSWAWAWAEIKKRYPEATYTIYEMPEGVNYFTDGRTCWVKTGLTIEGLEHIEYLPVMDFKNKSIPLESVTSFDVNKAIQRSLTKAAARHGLGLYIYAGEDLPDADKDAEATEKARNETINEKEWKALQSYIVSLAPSKPENQKDMKRLLDDVLARFGHTSDLWREITVGTQVDIRKAERDIKDDLAKNA